MGDRIFVFFSLILTGHYLYIAISLDLKVELVLNLFIWYQTESHFGVFLLKK